MVSYPHTFMPIKQITLVVIFVYIISRISLSKKIFLSNTILRYGLLYIFIGLAYTLYGLANNNPGAYQMAKIFVLWPIFYISIASAIQERHYKTLATIMNWSAVTIILTEILFLLTTQNMIPDIGISYIYSKSVFVLSSGFMTTYFIPHSSFIYVVPFITSLSIAKYANGMLVSKNSLVIIFMLWIAVLTSGRISLMIVTILSPIVSWVIISITTNNHNQTKTTAKATIMAGLFIVLLVSVMGYYQFSFERMLEYLLWKTDTENNVTMLVRKLQFYSIVESIKSDVWFGQGLGASAIYTRDSTFTWAYELQYVIYTLWFGIIGMVCYGYGIIWICKRMIEIIKKNESIYHIPILVGFVSILIANSVNPYLTSFENMWSYFLPLYVINNYSLGKLE